MWLDFTTKGLRGCLKPTIFCTTQKAKKLSSDFGSTTSGVLAMAETAQDMLNWAKLPAKAASDTADAHGVSGAQALRRIE